MNTCSYTVLSITFELLVKKSNFAHQCNYSVGIYQCICIIISCEIHGWQPYICPYTFTSVTLKLFKSELQILYVYTSNLVGIFQLISVEVMAKNVPSGALMGVSETRNCQKAPKWHKEPKYVTLASRMVPNNVWRPYLFLFQLYMLSTVHT